MGGEVTESSSKSRKKMLLSRVRLRLSQCVCVCVCVCRVFNFKNLACSKILSEGKKKKTMVAIKAFDLVAASEVNCSLERGRSL